MYNNLPTNLHPPSHLPYHTPYQHTLCHNLSNHPHRSSSRQLAHLYLHSGILAGSVVGVAQYPNVPILSSVDPHIEGVADIISIGPFKVTCYDTNALFYSLVTPSTNTFTTFFKCLFDDSLVVGCIRTSLSTSITLLQVMSVPFQWLDGWIIDIDRICVYLPGHVPVAVMVLYGCCIYPHLSYTGLGQAFFQSLFQ